MKLLLDTRMLLWAAAGLLPKKAIPIVTDANNTLFFSPASIWEICIKKNLGRSDFKVDPELLWRNLADNDFHEMPITGKHALSVNDLPLLHKDPFDRILLSQAKSEGVMLLTSDSIMTRYPCPVLFIPK